MPRRMVPRRCSFVVSPNGGDAYRTFGVFVSIVFIVLMASLHLHCLAFSLAHIFSLFLPSFSPSLLLLLLFRFTDRQCCRNRPPKQPAKRPAILVRQNENHVAAENRTPDLQSVQKADSFELAPFAEKGAGSSGSGSQLEELPLHLWASRWAFGDRHANVVLRTHFHKDYRIPQSCIPTTTFLLKFSLSSIPPASSKAWLMVGCRCCDPRWAALTFLFRCLFFFLPRPQKPHCTVMTSPPPLHPHLTPRMRLDAVDTVGAPQPAPAHAAAHPTVCKLQRLAANGHFWAVNEATGSI